MHAAICEKSFASAIMPNKVGSSRGKRRSQLKLKQFEPQQYCCGVLYSKREKRPDNFFGTTATAAAASKIGSIKVWRDVI